MDLRKILRKRKFLPKKQKDRQEKLKKLKFAKHITQAQIDDLSDAMIDALSEQEGEIVSISHTYRKLEKGNKKGAISTRTIDKDDFKMSVAVQRIYEKSGKDNFKFVATGEWLTDPFYEFTDAIGLAWSDDFTLYYDDCYVWRPLSGRDRDTVQLNDVDPEEGVAYDVDLIAGKDDEEIVLTAKVYKSNSSGEANVVGEYGHVELVASDISIGFSGGSQPEVNMSVSFAADIDMASPDYDSFDY